MISLVRLGFSIVMVLLFVVPIAKAQTNEQDIFIRTQLATYRDWLSYNQLSKLVRADTIRNDSEQYTLTMTIASKQDWEQLTKIFDTLYHQSIATLLLKRLKFQLDMPNDAVAINIDAPDATIIITQKDKKVSAETWKKMGMEATTTPLSVFYEITNIDLPTTLVSNRSTEDILQRIKSGLPVFFQKYKPRIEQSKFDVIYNNGNYLIIEVNNIVSAVLDEGYFEHLTLTFEFKFADQKTSVTQDIEGKYAAGIIWAPRSSRYKDMTPKYTKQLKRFSMILTTKIAELIK